MTTQESSGDIRSEHSVGDLIAGKYRIIRLIGEGATGTVHLCEHTALEKQVAVKVLHRELTDDTGLVERFQREARMSARLDHPNSVRVTDFGQDHNGTLYLAMEYVAGRDLAELLDTEWPLSDERVVHIMSGVLSALSAAHALGIVHRDLKPENILVRTPGQPIGQHAAHEEVVKVCDFGIAQFSSTSPRITEREPEVPNQSSSNRRITGDGMVVGTCAYMSPEQARAQRLDARSDLYSAGVVLYQMLTQSLPFVGDSPMAVATMHCDTLPPPPSVHGPVNLQLESVCLRALSKTPEARYQNAAEMLAALQAACSGRASRNFWGRASRPPAAPVVQSSVGLVTYRQLPASANTQHRHDAGMAVQRIELARTRETLLPPATSVSSTPSGGNSGRRMLPWVLGVASLALPVFAAVPFLVPQSDLESEVTSEAPEAAQHATSAPAAQLAPALPEYPEASVALALPLPLPLPAVATPVQPEHDNVNANVPPPPVTTVAIPTPSAVVAVRASAPTAREQRVAVVRPRKASASERTLTSTVPTATTPSADEPRSELLLQPSASTMTAPTPLDTAALSALALDALPAAAPTALPAATTEDRQPSASAATHTTTEHTQQASKGTLAAPTARMLISFHIEKLPGGVSKASLRSALNHAGVARCYQAAAPKHALPMSPVTAKLEVATNMTGRIVSARVDDATLPESVRSCIEQVARTGQIRDADVGPVHATFAITSSPRSLQDAQSGAPND